MGSRMRRRMVRRLENRRSWNGSGCGGLTAGSTDRHVLPYFVSACAVQIVSCQKQVERENITGKPPRSDSDFKPHLSTVLPPVRFSDRGNQHCLGQPGDARGSRGSAVAAEARNLASALAGGLLRLGADCLSALTGFAYPTNSNSLSAEDPRAIRSNRTHCRLSTSADRRQ